MPLNRLISACSKPSSRGPSAHGLDPWGKPGPTFPSDGRLTGGSRLSPGRRLYAHFDARLLCFVLLLLLRSAAPGIAAPAATAEGERGMVATAQHEASEVGLQILRAGGNAIDAAVAIGYALAVVDPCCGNIGGGGFMLIHTADGPHPAGDRLVQPDLAKTLALIAEGGPDAFYRGPIAAAVATASAAQGGIFTKEDFAAYTATEMAPIRCTYRGYGILSAPPPSAGGTI